MNEPMNDMSIIMNVWMDKCMNVKMDRYGLMDGWMNQ